MLKVWWFRFLTYILGYTFAIKLLELHEYEGINGLQQLKKEIPEVSPLLKMRKSMRQN